MGNINILYGVGIRNAIESNDLEQMKAKADEAKQHIKDYGDISSAFVELLEAIEKLEGK